eukprot:scaffold22258_cov56-Isochrysis_galbana.AAC.1
MAAAVDGADGGCLPHRYGSAAAAAPTDGPISGSGDGSISEWREWRRRLRLKPVRGDGNCLFRCVAAEVYGDEESHGVVSVLILEGNAGRGRGGEG